MARRVRPKGITEVIGGDASSSRYDEIFYEACVNAWIDSRNAEDRAIISFSVVAIGGVTSYLATARINNWLQFFSFSLSGIFFVLTMLTSVYIYRRNAKYIEHIVRGDNDSARSENERLERLDKIKWTFMVLAIALCVFGGIVRAFSLLPVIS